VQSQLVERGGEEHLALEVCLASDEREGVELLDVAHQDDVNTRQIELLQQPHIELGFCICDVHVALNCSGQGGLRSCLLLFRLFLVHTFAVERLFEGVQNALCGFMSLALGTLR